MLISIIEIKKRKTLLIISFCKSLKRNLLLDILSNTYQAEIFRVKKKHTHTHIERVGGGEASKLELEGNPRLGKLMAMGKNPFP
jgi:hypothetical protein